MKKAAGEEENAENAESTEAAESERVVKGGRGAVYRRAKSCMASELSSSSTSSGGDGKEQDDGGEAPHQQDRLPSKARDPPGTYRDKHDTLRSEANHGVIIDRTAAQWKDSSFRVREMD